MIILMTTLIILPQRLSKVFEKSVYWNECKTTSENKTTKNSYRYLF